MSGEPKGTEDAPNPFDEDSPFWVIPNALQLGYALGVAEATEHLLSSPSQFVAIMPNPAVTRSGRSVRY